MSLKHQVLAFAAGTVFGFSFACLWIQTGYSTFLLYSAESSWPPDNALVTRVETNLRNGPIEIQSPIVYEVNSDIAQNLAERVRILCWIVTNPDNVEGARVVKATWGKRCDVLLFTGTREDKGLPTVTLNMTEDLPHLVWGKTKRGFKYIYKNYLDRADWFLKADDRNYVVMENLRYMLQAHNPNKPVYFGRQFLKHPHQGYMSGGAGYVLSREALRRFVEAGLTMTTDDECRTSDDVGQEDLELGTCLENVGVAAGDSRDELGRGRFFPFDPATHVIPELIEDIGWYWEYTNISYSQGVDCCSDTTISFHHVFPELMYIYDYLIYNLHSSTINYL